MHGCILHTQKEFNKCILHARVHFAHSHRAERVHFAWTRACLHTCIELGGCILRA